MKKTFYWDTAMDCYDCATEEGQIFFTWTESLEWVIHSYKLYDIGDVVVPDTCLILNQIPVNDENFL